MKPTDKTRREEILRENHGGGYSPGNHSTEPDTRYSWRLVSIVAFASFIVGLIVGAVIN